jgi:hypothetical protein
MTHSKRCAHTRRTFDPEPATDLSRRAHDRNIGPSLRRSKQNQKNPINIPRISLACSSDAGLLKGLRPIRQKNRGYLKACAKGLNSGSPTIVSSGKHHLVSLPDSGTEKGVTYISDLCKQICKFLIRHKHASRARHHSFADAIAPARVMPRHVEMHIARVERVGTRTQDGGEPAARGFPYGMEI